MESTFDPIEKVQLYKEVATQIMNKITRGELKPGDKLPPERELAVQLGVSRPAVREALSSLEMMGFIQSRMRGGTFIKQATIDNLLQTYSSVLSGDERLIPELIEVRYMLEGEVARLAARRASPEDIENLEKSLDIMKNSIANGGIGLEGDDLFHECLATAAKNLALEKITLLCRDMLSATREAALERIDDLWGIIEGHRTIITAIKSGDADFAEASMRHHLKEAYKNATKSKVDAQSDSGSDAESRFL